MIVSTLFGQFPFLKKLFADSAYAGPVFHDGLANTMPCLATEIVRRSDQAKGFLVLPKRWIAERTIGWLGRCRRLARGLGKPIPPAPAFPPPPPPPLKAEKTSKTS